MNPIFIFIILVTFLNLRTTGELMGLRIKRGDVRARVGKEDQLCGEGSFPLLGYPFVGILYGLPGNLGSGESSFIQVFLCTPSPVPN